MNRTISVARVQALTQWNMLVWPWAILATALVVNIAIFAVIGDLVPDGPKTGGLASLYLTAMYVAAATILQQLPFALGFGVTRRTFQRATSLLVAAWSLGSAVVLYLLALVERASGGWGVRMSFFDLPFLSRSNPALQILEYAVPLLLMIYLGFGLGTASLRWGVNGVMLLVVGTIAVLGLVAVVLGWLHALGAVLDWFGTQSAPALLAGWPLVLTAVVAGLTFLGLRRVTI